MFTRDFCLDVSLHIISVVTVATLEAESREANIFTLGVSGAVGPYTLPVIYYITVLTVYRVSEGVAVA